MENSIKNSEKKIIIFMIPNRQGRKQSETLATGAKSEGCKAKSEGGQQHCPAVKKIIRITKRNNF